MKKEIIELEILGNTKLSIDFKKQYYSFDEEKHISDMVDEFLNKIDKHLFPLVYGDLGRKIINSYKQ